MDASKVSWVLIVYLFVHGSNLRYLLLKIDGTKRNEGYTDKKTKEGYGYKSTIPRNTARRFRVPSEHEIL